VTPAGDWRTDLLRGAPSRRLFVAVALIVPALLLLLLAGVNREFVRSEQIRVGLSQSYDRRVALIELLSSLKDAETAQRGFLLAGEEAFLQPFAPARRAIARGWAADRPADAGERAAHDRIGRLVRAKLAELDRTIALQRAGDGEAARRLLRTGQGKRLMDALRVEIGGAVRREALRSAAARERFRAQRQQLRGIVTVAVIALIVGLVVALLAAFNERRRRHAARVEAVEAAERNQTILDATIDAILIVNPSGTVETVNGAATRMLGYSSEELQRRDVGTVVDIAPGEGSFARRVGLIDGQLRRRFLTDRHVLHRDGRSLAVDVAIGVMHLPSGPHLVVSLRDIAERKRVERVKDDLMSTVSHELRTPLTSVVGALGLLRTGNAGRLPDAAERLVTIADNNARRLIRLINDMLDIDRIESGKLAMEREPIDLRQVVERACADCQGLVAERRVEIACDPADAPVMVSGDAERLLQVAANLLSNAVRAAPDGSVIEIGVGVGPDGRALLTVDDRGPGIPPAFRDQLFRRFTRANRDEGSPGTGLGLAISREIVLRHDGAIWFEDRAGGGTRFAVALPRIGTAGECDHAAPCVLVCEHDDERAAALSAAVATEGCRIERARNVEEAHACVRRRRYAALLVAWDLPGGGGLALASALKAMTPSLAVPIVVVSADARNDGESLSPLDMVDWIDTPDDQERLGVALRTAMARDQHRRAVVLHLDDDRDLLDVVAAALEPETQVLAASDIAGARALIEGQMPDAVILDLHLANGTGTELIPFLVDEHGLPIPTIIYSAHDVSRDLASQVDAVLVKARGSMPDLKATVRRVVRDRRDREPAA
jgi:PAS domain S-box-containing protein